MLKIFSSTAQPQTPLSWIALLRIMLGVLFLTTWASNALKGFYTPDGLVNFFTDVFPQLGLFLLLGLLTPWTSAAAAFFILNTFLATFGRDWPWSYATILGILFVVFWTRAGRSLGLDAWLLKRRGPPPAPFLW